MWSLQYDTRTFCADKTEQLLTGKESSPRKLLAIAYKNLPRPVFNT